MGRKIKSEVKKQFPQPGDNKTVQWEFTPGFNMVQASRIKRKQEGSLSFRVLRNFSVNYPIARSCIDYIKTKAIKLNWKVVPSTEDVDFNADDPRIDEVESFFKSPLGNRSTYRKLIEAIIEDYLVIGSIALERVITQGGKFMDELKLVDSSTIRIMLDDEGRVPEPPEVAYAQVIRGRVVAKLTQDELIFTNRQNRTNSLYGLSPLESLIIQADSAIKGAKNSNRFFTDGTLPEGFLEMPEGWTQEQIKTFETYFNALLAGNPMRQRQIKALPAGAKWVPIKKPEDINFKRFEQWLMKQTCSVFGVPPSDIGFEEDVNRSTSEVQSQKGQERAMRPVAVMLEDMFSAIIQDDFGFEDLGFKFIDVDPIDREQEAKIDNTRLEGGVLSVDEIRSREGLEPIGLDHYIKGKNVVLVEQLKTEPQKTTESQTDGEQSKQVKVKTKKEAKPKKKKVDDGESEKVYRQDLILWQKQSVRAYKDKRPFKKFITKALEPWMVEEIYFQLNKTMSRSDIHKVFSPYFNNSMKALKTLQGISDDLKKLAKDQKDPVPATK